MRHHLTPYCINVRLFLRGVLVLLSIMATGTDGFAQLSVRPTNFFMDGAKKSVALNVSNAAGEPTEVWIEAKMGYVTSGDTGGAVVVFDSTDRTLPSAVSWVRAYPSRFFLGTNEAQVVRLMVTPPPGVSEGEYWARIMVTSKAKTTGLLLKNKAIKGTTGLTVRSQLGIPLHYRIGRVTTGLDITGFTVDGRGDQMRVSMNLRRTGNASYWGFASFRLLNSAGKVVLDERRNVAVYTTFAARVDIPRPQVPAGEYTLEVTFNTTGRQDIARKDAIDTLPVILRQSVILE